VNALLTPGAPLKAGLPDPTPTPTSTLPARKVEWTVAEVCCFFAKLAENGRKNNFALLSDAMRDAGHPRQQMQVRNFYFKCVKDFKRCYEKKNKGGDISSRSPDELMEQLTNYWHGLLHHILCNLGRWPVDAASLFGGRLPVDWAMQMACRSYRGLEFQAHDRGAAQHAGA
jgi:hypothetical protein